MSQRALTFGMSPCPNDTFAFHAFVHGLTGLSLPIDPQLHDIEELNQHARDGHFDVTKVSVGSLSDVIARYRPLASGAALGAGVGPLIVARERLTIQDLAGRSVMHPGRSTTAHMLLQRATDRLGIEIGKSLERRYDQILNAVRLGEVDAGVIIHESRFTYADHGLHRICDLGDLWEQSTGLPVPLAVICARRDLTDAVASEIEQAIATSVELAWQRPQLSLSYVRAHAQELSDEVCQQHIDLYVNEHTRMLDPVGRRAIAELTGITWD